MPRPSGRQRLLSGRRPLLAAVGFGLFVLFDIALFAWLILDTFSQRALEDVLLETRQDVEPIAADLLARATEKGSDDLFVLVSVAEETKTYIDSVLTQRNLVRRFEIRDRDGTVVFRKRQEDGLPLEDDQGPRLSFDEEPEVRLVETKIPIGEDLGTLVIGVDEGEVQRRISVLRRDLIRHASLVGVFSVTLLIAGLVAVLRLQRRTRQLEDQAERSERMAYVGTLASGLAHEIRSPLNSLSLNMQMLEEEAKEDGGSGSQLRLLSITRSELRRLEDLATDFLAYAKPQPVELRAVPMPELLDRARTVLAAEIEEQGVEVSLEDRSRGLAVEVDPAQINQMLLNLIHNALAAMSSPSKSPRLELVSHADDGEPTLEVRDNGEGVPEHVRIKMFDLFYSNRKGGTGLGLAIVQRIAESHGARIEVDTVRHEGTTMRIVFPAEKART